VGLFPYVYVAFAGKVRCFDGETGQLLWEVADVHKGGVSALCVSHNQRFFMTGGVEGSVSLLFHIYTCVSHCFLMRMCFVKCVVYMYIYAVLYYGRRRRQRESSAFINIHAFRNIFLYVCFR